MKNNNVSNKISVLDIFRKVIKDAKNNNENYITRLMLIQTRYNMSPKLSDCYIDNTRNLLEKSGYLCKYVVDGKIVNGKYLIGKDITESLTTNELKKEYDNHWDKIRC